MAQLLKLLEQIQLIVVGLQMQVIYVIKMIKEIFLQMPNRIKLELELEWAK